MYTISWWQQQANILKKNNDMLLGQVKTGKRKFHASRIELHALTEWHMLIPQSCYKLTTLNRESESGRGWFEKNIAHIDIHLMHEQIITRTCIHQLLSQLYDFRLVNKNHWTENLEQTVNFQLYKYSPPPEKKYIRRTKAFQVPKMAARIT